MLGGAPLPRPPVSWGGPTGVQWALCSPFTFLKLLVFFWFGVFFVCFNPNEVVLKPAGLCCPLVALGEYGPRNPPKKISSRGTNSEITKNGGPVPKGVQVRMPDK